MYLGTSTEKVVTHPRPHVERLTAPLPQSHHILEDILADSRTRTVLAWMTRRDSEGKCFFMHLCENFDNPSSSSSVTALRPTG